MRVDPTQLLDDCEQVWREAGEPDWDGVVAGVERRMLLVLDALVAYRLLAAQEKLPHENVHARWPACTVHIVVHGGPTDESALARRILEARARVVAARPDLAGEPPDRDAVEAARDWLNSAKESADRLGWGWPFRGGTGKGGSALARPSPMPELRLGPGAGSVLLTLGARFPEAADHRWDLAADGETVCASPPHWIVPGPLRRIEATDPSGTVHTCTVVDPDVALLAFTPEGHSVPTGEPLPATELLLLHAGTLETEGAEGATLELPTPYGWSGWTLSKVSLSGVHRIRAAQARTGRWLDIAVEGPLAWEGGATLTCLTSEDDAPIWSTAPHLRLPRRPGEPPRSWTVEVRRAGEDVTLCRLTGSSGALVDPWQRVAKPVFGPYEVFVGSAGTRKKRRMAAFLAEGVTSEPSVQWRHFVPSGGVKPARLSVVSRGALTVSPPAVSYTPYETTKDLLLRAGAAGYPLRAGIPHSEVRLELDGNPDRWTVRALDINADDLHRDCTLTVRLPEQAVVVDPVLRMVVADSQLADVLPERRIRRRKGDLRFKLSALADTVRNHVKAELRLFVAGVDVPVGVVRTHPIAEGAAAGDEGIVLRGLRHPGELHAQVFRAYEPWQPALGLAVGVDGRIPLPPDWTGPLVVRLHAGAPLPESAVAWPDLRERDTLVVPNAARRYPHASPTPEAEMADYLAGRGSLPGVARAGAHQWVVAARGRDLQRCGVREVAPAECSMALGAAGLSALYAARDSGLSSAELAPALVASGLAAMRVREVTNPWAVREVWRKAPLCALLLTSPLLPYLSQDEAYAADELYPDEAELLGEVSEFLGVNGSTILEEGNDPSSGVGRFGETVRVIDQLPDHQQREMWSSAGVVPRALLETDTRAAAAWEAFRARRALQYYAAQEEADEWLQAVDTFLKEGHVLLTDAVRRQEPCQLRSRDEAWMRVPQFLLGCAVLARLAAWGDARAAGLERQVRPLWAAMTVHAPALTAVNLALAESLVAAHHVYGAS